jgi:hypothetical protein
MVVWHGLAPTLTMRGGATTPTLVMGTVGMEVTMTWVQPHGGSARRAREGKHGAWRLGSDRCLRNQRRERRCSGVAPTASARTWGCGCQSNGSVMADVVQTPVAGLAFGQGKWVREALAGGVRQSSQSSRLVSSGEVIARTTSGRWARC